MLITNVPERLRAAQLRTGETWRKRMAGNLEFVKGCIGFLNSRGLGSVGEEERKRKKEK